MSTTNGRNLGLRLDEADTKDLNDFEKGTGIEATTLARNALRACLAYWRQHGKISFPLRLVEITTALPPDADAAAQKEHSSTSKKDLEPTDEEKNVSRLNEDSPAVQRVRGSIAAAKKKL